MKSLRILKFPLSANQEQNRSFSKRRQYEEIPMYRKQCSQQSLPCGLEIQLILKSYAGGKCYVMNERLRPN